MKHNDRIIAGLAFVAVCLTAFAATPAERADMNANPAEVVTNSPRITPGDVQDAQSGVQNVRDSDRYESLVHSNPRFRTVRERKECGPTDDAPMHADMAPG